MTSAAPPTRPHRLLGIPIPPPRNRIFWVAMVVVAVLANVWVLGRATAVHRTRVPFSPFFLEQVRTGNVADITSRGTAIQGSLRRSVRVGAGHASPVDRFSTEVPAFADEHQLARLLQNKGVVVNARPLSDGLVWWKSLIFGIGPTALLLLLLYWLFRRLGRTAGLGGFARARARRYVPSAHATSFDDVAGIDEAKHELAEIVDFLRNPEKYQRLGGRIPRGVLLSGPPGTGKTLLARAVAGEAGVPFFALSASEFVEAVVGIGASRVRDLFKQAKEAAPAIVFIDELDAIGRSRSGRSGIGSEEREQTLNQILTEMDGFDPSSSVIVIAATNRPDILDAALLRPGRFDRRFNVQQPDRRGRRLILDVHTVDVPLAADVDLDEVAARTPGFAGADLANLVNEAALLAARSGHDAVTAADLSAALERLILGAERGIVLSETDRRRTACHEAGHAVVAMLTPGTDPVRKISIIPRGVSLGVTYYESETERWNYTPTELTAMLKTLLGGQAAEQIVFGEPTTGLESDLERITQIARRMVGRWGMSDRIGFVSVLGNDGSLDGDPASEATRAIVDDEVRSLIEQANHEVLALLREERLRLDALTAALLDQETLDGDEIYRAVGLDPPRVLAVEQHALELT